jgi:tetratricopeptide (TPR) repeat protein
VKYLILSIAAFCAFLTGAFAQQNASLNLKKSKKFESKQLPAEKTGNKKYTIPRSFIQNTVTHYNYYFNANAKLNEIIARAKMSFRDDYTRLLPFYNYTPEETSQFRDDLDSVIYKSTAGILLHDLRTNWVDNLYLLIGKAYYLRNDPDSAFITFQYINYAFSPKEKDGYDKVIGSNANREEGGSVLSVSTKENNSLLHKTISRAPSRNESLIWQIRTYLEKNQFTEAAVLIETLKYDPVFPKRLHTSLEEMQALYFYKQSLYDSAALHLERALGNAESSQERARWEYLTAQLYERAGKHDLAATFYNNANKHTIDPLLEVYSILNALRQDGSGANVQDAIKGLVKMAGRDKYATYRDIIYYTAAIVAEENNNPEAAKTLLLKSIKYSNNNPNQKSRSFLALGDLSYGQQQYVAAKSYYDSVDIDVILPQALPAYMQRKANLTQIALQYGIITRQDSLQRIVALPQEEREAYIKKLVRQLRKQRGLKEEPTAVARSNFSNTTAPLPDLFGNTSKGDWYFDNASLKTKGAAEFKSRWGNRPNSDNWRRSNAIAQQFDIGNTNDDINNAAQAGRDATSGISFGALLAKLPLTPELQKKSLDSTEHALFALGIAYQDGPEDYLNAISAYERLLANFPASVHTEEALFNLYYCYGKIGKISNQQQVKQLLAAKFPQGNYYSKIIDPTGASSPDNIKKKEATAEYEAIYDLFIEGKFAQAVVKKAVADKKYGTHYWTPQLLYIEAVYHIRQREDSTAKVVLNNIIRLYPQSALKEKSERLLDVLSRRKEIEDYLARLKIDRGQDDQVIAIEEPLPIKVKDTAAIQQIVIAPVKDTVVKQVIVSEPVKPKEIPPPAIVKAEKPVVPVKDTLTAPKAPSVDSTKIVKQEINITASGYTHKPQMAHYVAFVMTKVDPVYVSEAKNAFNRYNRENYNDKTIALSNLPLTDDIKLLLFNKFDNADAAMQYINKAQKLAATDIIPWLTANKYFFILITEPNLEVLKNAKNMDAYRDFLRKAYPGKEF